MKKQKSTLIVSAVVQQEEWDAIERLAAEEDRSRSKILGTLIKEALELRASKQ